MFGAASSDLTVLEYFLSIPLVIELNTLRGKGGGERERDFLWGRWVGVEKKGSFSWTDLKYDRKFLEEH